MFISLKAKVLTVLLLVLLLCSLWASALWLTPLAAPSLRSAVFLPKPSPIGDFSLMDHKAKLFSPQRLLGQWSLLSYGYTFCPDICPTTLATLHRFHQLIQQDDENNEVALLFYTIDPGRDTAQQLKQYLAFFPSPFLGLMPSSTEPSDMEKAKPFEKSLGILSNFTADVGGNKFAYSVSHGFYLYLINPQGRLQAIFKPRKSYDGISSFNSADIYSDYQAIRHFVAQ